MKTLILITISALLVACGQKGALYLPTKPTTTSTDEPVVSTDSNDY